MQVYPQDPQVSSMGNLQIWVHSHIHTRDIQPGTDVGGKSSKVAGTCRYLQVLADMSLATNILVDGIVAILRLVASSSVPLSSAHITALYQDDLPNHQLNSQPCP
jgi:hypothetical protein